MTESRPNNLKRTAFLFLKLAIVGLALWYIYHKVSNDVELPEITTTLTTVLNQPRQLLFGFGALLLMPLNWSIEALKWKYLVDKLEPMPFLAALKAVLAGLTLSTFTPNRVGELAGRALFLSAGNRVKGTLITAIGTTSQLLITLICGSTALFLAAQHIPLFILPSDGAAWYVLFGLTLGVSALLIYFYLRTAAIANLLGRINWLQRVEKYCGAVGAYSIRELANVLRMSLFRYVVFSLQFFLVLQLFGVEIDPVMAVLLIPVTFLVMTVIPTIGLTEVGVREVVAMEVLGLVSDHHIGIVAATFTLWAINWMIPAIAGGYFVMGMKLQKVA